MEISIGVIGCGWWSSIAHLPTIAAHPGVRLAAVADTSEEKRRWAAEKFGAGAHYARWEDMLESCPLDAVVVATPPDHHFAAAAAALSRGINVLVDKPMVVEPERAAEMVAIAASQDISLMVGYTYHHTVHAVRLRDEILSGRIGRVEHVSCTFASIMRELLRGNVDAYRNGETGFAMEQVPQATTYSDPRTGGQAHSQLTHSVALALHLTGLEPIRVAALTASFELDVDLADSLAVQFAGGALGSFDCAGMVVPGQDEILQLRIFGERGHVLLDPIAGRASIHGSDGATEVLETLRPDQRYPAGAPVQNLIGVMQGAEANRASGQLGQRVTDLIDAALRSARDLVAVEIRPMA